MLKTKLIDFQDDKILGIKTEEGEVYLGVRKTLRDLGFTDGQARRQVENIGKDIVLESMSRRFAIETSNNDGNKNVVRETLCIREDGVTLWLAKISLTPKMKKENPKLVEKLVKYQLECAKVLHDAFMGTEEKEGQFFDTMGLEGRIVNVIDRKVSVLDTYYRPTHKNKLDKAKYIKDCLGVCATRENVKRAKDITLMRIGNYSKWEEVPIDIMNSKETNEIISDTCKFICSQYGVKQVSFI